MKRGKLPLIVLFILAVSAWIAPYLPLTGAEPDLSLRFLPPSGAHPLGTDELGRDILLRLLYGGRVSLGAGLIAACAATMLGALIGITSGYAGGRIDAVLMRLTDAMIALPMLPLLIVLSALDPSKIGLSTTGTGLGKIILLIALTGWPVTARLARARALTLKSMDFVLAAKGLGVSAARIALRHILPNLSGTVMIAATLSVGNVILAESALSFLGLGIQPPMPSWGNMLSNAQDNIWEHASLALYPGFLIFVTVLAFNFLGDALQQNLDPKKPAQTQL